MVRKQVPNRYYEIVVPTDFSPTSTRAMAFAMTLARPGTRVTAVHALDAFPYKFGPEESSNLRSQQAWASAHDSMASWMREGKFCAAHMAVIEGEPAIAVAEFACANRADLVVLGTSARRHGERLLLGSGAEEIFRELKCPVVVLGPKADFRKKRKWARFVFATDLEPHSLAALPKLLNISNRFDSDVLVIRAIHPDIKSRSERARIRTTTRARLEAAGDSNLQKHIKTIHVEFASPIKAITNFAHRTKANAIIMGVRSGGYLSRAATHIPWTLAHRVIAEAKCPVITIRG